MESERAAGKLSGRRRQKALSKAERQRQRARRNREKADQPMNADQPKMIRPWPQSWRVPTQTKPLTSGEYARYLKTPHWQEFKERYQVSGLLQECFVCGQAKYELHHHTYTRLGNEGLQDVVPLCEAHHRAVHKAVKAGVTLTNAHTYVKMRFQRDELEMRIRSLKTEE